PLYREGVTYAVTTRKAAAESGAPASTQRKTVLNSATRVSIIATDAEGMITVFNSGAERMLGYSAEEVTTQRSLLELHDPNEVAHYADVLSIEFHRPIEGFDVLVLRAALEDVEEREWTYIRKNGDANTVDVAVAAR